MKNIFFILLFSIINSIVWGQQQSKNEEPCTVETKENEVLLTSIEAIIDKSENDNFKVKYKIEKIDNNNYQIEFTFYTTVSHILFARGFCYTLFDTKGNSYPLTIKSLNGAAMLPGYMSSTNPCWELDFVRLNISKSILMKIASNGLSKIKFQIKNNRDHPALDKTGQMSWCLPPDWHYEGHEVFLGNSGYLEYKINQTDKIKFQEYVQKYLKVN